MFFLKLILLPFSCAYGVVVWCRNKLFDWGIFKSRIFKSTIISVGNITTGGTGKSPHVQYLIDLIKGDFKVATLSRGYKRKTKGFLVVESNTSAQNSGDEPKQFKFNFPNILVAVGENRVEAIEQMLQLPQAPEVILLDDAFQHRWVKPQIQILLIDYNQLQEQNFMLPSGTLREFPSGQHRADIIVVSKAPKDLSPMEKRRFTEIIKPREYQKIFYSYIEYSSLMPLNSSAEELLGDGLSSKLSDYKVLLFTGIANAEPLKNHLKNICKDVSELKFPDHHDFSLEDSRKIISAFTNVLSSRKILLTTEKDAMRIKDSEAFAIPDNLPLFYIPIKVKFHQEKLNFDEVIFQYLREGK